MHLLKKISFVRPCMGFLQPDGILNQASSAVWPCQNCRYTWNYQGMLKKLSLVNTSSFRSLRSCRKNKKTETQSLNPLTFGSFCTTGATQKTYCGPGLRKCVVGKKSHCDLQGADLLERKLFARQRSTHS